MNSFDPLATLTELICTKAVACIPAFCAPWRNLSSSDIVRWRCGSHWVRRVEVSTLRDSHCCVHCCSARITSSLGLRLRTVLIFLLASTRPSIYSIDVIKGIYIYSAPRIGNVLGSRSSSGERTVGIRFPLDGIVVLANVLVFKSRICWNVHSDYVDQSIVSVGNGIDFSSHLRLQVG